MSLARPFFLALLTLHGCASPQGGWAAPGWSWPFPAAGNRQVHAGGNRMGAPAQFSFDWQLAGDPEIMPIQVFDDGNGMWLQFPPDGAWPAVFDATVGGWRALSYRRAPPYMLLDGVYEHLELRGGHLRGSVRRQGAMRAGSSEGQPQRSPGTEPTTGQPSPDATPVQVALVDSVAPPAPALPAAAPVATKAGPKQESRAEQSPIPGLSSGPTPKESSTPGLLGAMPASSPVVDLTGQDTAVADTSVGLFAVSPADGTMRQALQRWASQARWTFSPDHWAVDVDIPLVGAANFHTDFKSAVRELLAATEMGDRPLQPCFYSNRLLRVVPYAQACDRRSGMGVVS